MNWAWKSGMRMRGNVQDIGERLQYLKRRNRELKPEHVLEDAEKQSSPLHDCFEWNDGKAAHEYRIWQARRIINSIQVVIERGPHQKPKSFKVFMSIPPEITEEGISQRYYVDLRDATAEEREILREECLRELKAIRRKYAEFQEFLAIWDAIDAQEKPKPRGRSKRASRSVHAQA